MAVIAPANLGGGQKRKIAEDTRQEQVAATDEGGEVKRTKVVSDEAGVGLLALTGYESEEDDVVEEVVDADQDDQVTEADLKVLHALGAAAALDME